MFALDTLTVDSQVAFRLRDEYFFWRGGGGGGLMCGIKIPQQDFVLKMQGGGGGGGAYLRDTTVSTNSPPI